jgi:hypothetical protein
MTLDLTPAFLVFLAVFIGVAMWRMVRRRNLRNSGALPDVPDAPTTAVPIEAPGMTAPYSSLDPFAPPKEHSTRTRVDGEPESP